MMVRKLDLTNFRCYPALRLELPAGLVVVTGSNASGKSSLLEAIFVASAGRSPRTMRDSELVRWGAKDARVEAVFERDEGRYLDIVFELDVAGGPRKRLLADGNPVRRAAELLSRVPLVLFTPADLQLAQAAPVVRRRFMNLALARLRPAYADDLARYGRALMQRNRLLAMGAGEAELRPWTAQMVAAGAEVAVQRRRFAAGVGALAAGLHAALAGEGEALGVEYAGSLAGDDPAAAAEQYTALLGRAASEELRMRRTLVGPHRDDLRLTLGGQALRRFGSQGQQRTAALALKLAEADLIRRETGAPPLLLLDDCLSELDEARASHVLGLTEAYGQLIVTSAAREAALERASAALWLHLRDGEVERIES
jgi:DNA replication and repair protein RecF